MLRFASCVTGAQYDTITLFISIKEGFRMNFWKKFWKLVSKKDLVFITLIFAAVIVFSFVETQNKVKVTFNEASVDVVSAKYSMNIPYEMIDYAQLEALPEAGHVVSGRDDMTIRYGTWANDRFGEYYICADLAAENCIVVHLKDGRFFLFSRLRAEKTSTLFDTLQTYLH